MSFGLEVYKASGAVMFNSANRLSRLIGVYSYSLGGGASVNISVPGLALDGTWGVLLLRSTNLYAPRLVMSANNVLVDNSFWSLSNIGNIAVVRI